MPGTCFINRCTKLSGSRCPHRRNILQTNYHLLQFAFKAHHQRKQLQRDTSRHRQKARRKIPEDLHLDGPSRFQQLVLVTSITGTGENDQLRPRFSLHSKNQIQIWLEAVQEVVRIAPASTTLPPPPLPRSPSQVPRISTGQTSQIPKRDEESRIALPSASFVSFRGPLDDA